MRNKLWQGMAAVVLGGALAATAMGGASCGDNNSSSTGGTGGTYSSTGGQGGTGGALTTYNMQLTGAQEVPSNPSLATAAVKVILDRNTGAVTVTGSFQSLTSTATAAHIHGPAAVGASAAVLIPLTVPASTSGTVSGTGSMTAPQMNDMVGGMTYVNIHSMNYPDGEIRAQILP